MQYDTHVGFINPHSKGICRYHYTDFSALPAFLPEVFYGIIQSGVIEVGGNIFVYQ